MERDEQIEKLTSFIFGAPGTASRFTEGAGRIAVISGPVASGKTALLHRVLEQTAEAGPRVLSAVTSPAEQRIPFGVVEQLLRDAPRTAAGRPPSPGRGGPSQTRSYDEVSAARDAIAAQADPSTDGLYDAAPVPTEILRGFDAQLAELGAREKVLIAVDDVQYADPQSLHCLAYALRRAAVGALIVTHGPDTGGAPSQLLWQLLHPPRGLHIQVGPLSVAGVGRLLGAAAGSANRSASGTAAVPLDTTPDESAPADTPAASLHAATGGNPLLVQGFLEDHLGRQRSTPPDGTGRTDTPTLGADAPAAEHADGLPYAGEHFLRSALIYVHRTGADGLRIAQGVALLGSAGSPSLLARLVGAEERTVRQVVASLGDAGILQGARFRHGRVQAAIVESLADDAVPGLRRRAARLLYEAGAAPLVVAAQLLGHETHAPDEEWVPRVLREAAHAALAMQRVGLAVRCLRMAESCCRDEDERMLLQATLAKFIWRVEPWAWPQQVKSLTGAMRSGRLPAADTLKLVCDLLWNGWEDDAATAIRQVVDALPDAPDTTLAAELWQLRLTLASTYPAVLEQVGGMLAPVHGSGFPPTASEDSRPTAATALYGVLNGATRPDGTGTGVADEDFADRAERVLSSTRLTEETAPGMRACLVALVYADRLSTATQWADRLLAEATDRGAPGWAAALRGTRAHMSLRRGRLAHARRLAEQSLEQLSPQAWGVGIGMPLSALIETGTAMGDHEAAAELVDRPVPEEMFRTRYGLHYLYARGRHQLATGRHHAALTDFAACGELMRRWRMDRSTLAPWRVGVAETWLALGGHEQAERFAREQLTGDTGPRVRGLTLRVLAGARPLDERPALLGKAVTLLQREGDWYGLARALSDLGQAYKQLGDAARSKLHLRRAWRIAESCGAQELYHSLQTGQTAAQPAPSRSATATTQSTLSQAAAVASLTDAERRVAALAAHGYTNREIGAKVCITVSTVEQHLTRVYRKINITHRQDLPVSLDIDVAHTA
ncbi:AAA family ATPase [Streptomyces sp. BR1]|uniref:AAA family ATPase n=1 Tax=Streptomyces sp. BR1 TaxID=1592323 RepID=UPI00402B7806